MFFKIKYLSGIILTSFMLSAYATDTPLEQEPRFNHSRVPEVDPTSNASSVQYLDREIANDSADMRNDTNQIKQTKSNTNNKTSDVAKNAPKTNKQ